MEQRVFIWNRKGNADRYPVARPEIILSTRRHLSGELTGWNRKGARRRKLWSATTAWSADRSITLRPARYKIHDTKSGRHVNKVLKALCNRKNVEGLTAMHQDYMEKWGSKMAQAK